MGAMQPQDQNLPGCFDQKMMLIKRVHHSQMIQKKEKIVLLHIHHHLL